VYSIPEAVGYHDVHRRYHATQAKRYKRTWKQYKHRTLWTVPQMSIFIIYNSTWSIVIQWIRVMNFGDNLT